MILVDLNQVLISNLMVHVNADKKMKIDETLLRHMVLNSIRSYNTQFKSKFGELVIACDSRKFWRKDVFPYYKAHRKADREKSPLDWTAIFEILNLIKGELKQYFPYKVIEVEGAEADDIIAVLTSVYSKDEEILILSSDKDFVQLQKYPNVTQYSPILKRFIRTDNPEEFVKEHILRGDRGDGIPNFLSSDNTFVAGERQKVITKKKLAEWLKKEPDEICTTDLMLRNYKRNQLLVDLDFVPEKIKNTIQTVYNDTKPTSRQKLMTFFIEKKLKNLMEVINEF